MTVNIPPVLTPRPQFTPEYWAKVDRKVTASTIDYVKDAPGGDIVEIKLKNGMAFRRKKCEISQLLTRKLEVNAELVGNNSGQFVTGLFVPGSGWAFRMSNEDIAEYVKSLAIAVHDREVTLQAAMRKFLAEKIETYLDSADMFIPGLDSLDMADSLLKAMEKGPEASK
jgi:hypothetical protein